MKTQIVQGKLIGADISTQKLSSVLKFIRGKGADKMKIELSFSQKKSDVYVLKLLKSVVSSAVRSFKIPAGDLFIKEVWSGPGPTRTTYAPRAKNMTTKIRHRTANVFLVLGRISEVKQIKKKGGEKKDGK